MLANDHIIGIVGVGQMGRLMAERLRHRFKNIKIYDKDPAQMQHFEKAAQICKRLDQMQDADAVITMLPNGQITKSIARDLGHILKKSSILLNTGTIGVDESKELAKILRENNLRYVDAPVSGGVQGARMGTLTFMVSGDDNDIDSVKPLMLAMGGKVVNCGNHGLAQAAKICNNMLLGITMMGACEVYALAQKLGLSAAVLTDIINSSSGRCWSTEINNPVPGAVVSSPSSRNYEGGFSARLLHKDLSLAVDAAVHSSEMLSGLAAAQKIYKSLSEHKESASKDMGYYYQYLIEKIK